MQSSAFFWENRPEKSRFFFFITRDLPTGLRREAVHKSTRVKNRDFRSLWILAGGKVLVARFLRVPPKSSYKRLILWVGLYKYAKMSTSNKVPEGLKDSECEKGNLGAWPPILYVLPMDLLQAKENSDAIKLKLPDGTIISMMIFVKGNPKEYLQHFIAVLRLINQKGLDAKCREADKELVKTFEVLEALKRKPNGPRGTSVSENDQEAL